MESIREAERLKNMQDGTINLRDAERRVNDAANNVDELVEIFTLETTNTDNIRKAFLSCVANIEDQLKVISTSGLGSFQS